MSENALNKVNEGYCNTLFSRLDYKENSVIILVVQRVPEKDLVRCDYKILITGRISK